MGRARSVRGVGLMWLAATLVVVQALGLMHGLLHDHARAGSTTAQAAALTEPVGGNTWVQALFDGHDSQADCDDFDHMTQAGHTGFGLPLFDVLPLRAAEVVCHEGWHLAQQAAGFLARGPPLALI